MVFSGEEGGEQECLGQLLGLRPFSLCFFPKGLKARVGSRGGRNSGQARRTKHVKSVAGILNPAIASWQRGTPRSVGSEALLGVPGKGNGWGGFGLFFFGYFGEGRGGLFGGGRGWGV